MFAIWSSPSVNEINESSNFAASATMATMATNTRPKTRVSVIYLNSPFDRNQCHFCFKPITTLKSFWKNASRDPKPFSDQ